MENQKFLNMNRVLQLLTLISFMAIHSELLSQCEINVYDFNEWEDATEFIEDDLGITPTEESLLPVQWPPLLRPFTLLFAELTGIGDTTLANEYLGISRDVRDEANSDFAMCLEANGILNIADALTFNICESTPSSISFDIKHIGGENDTFQILYIQGEIDVLSAALDTVSLEESGATAFAGAFLTGGPDDYTNVSIDIETIEGTMDDPAVADTALIWLIASGNEENSAYCIDSLTLNFVITNTDDIEEVAFNIYPNPTSDQLTIETESDGLVQIYDMNGRVAMKQNVLGRTTMSLLDLPSGPYTIRFESQTGVLSQKFSKL